MIKYISFFTGGGGADIGAMMARAEPIVGYEYIPEIAQWAESQLGHPVRVKNILDFILSENNLRAIPKADIFHFSPPCPSFSRANAKGGETENDLALALAICEIIEYCKPPIFTLENVYQYRNSESYKMIANSLNKVYGLSWDMTHVNFADLGVPQTRKRMIIRGIKNKVLPMYPEKEEWVGWYEAVEDIIHTFPDGELANWQLKRLPEKLTTMILNSTDSGPEARHRPRLNDQPMQTVTTSTRWKVLVEGVSGGKRPVTIRDEEQPCPTLVSGKGSRNYKLLMSGNNKTSATIRKENQPAHVNRATRTEVSRILVSKNRAFSLRDEKKPSTTILTDDIKRIVDENFKVLLVTTRGLARFMSFPDWYELPKKKTLANTILGNAVPPLGYSKILKQLIDTII